jgi:hypothetical protein
MQIEIEASHSVAATVPHWDDIIFSHNILGSIFKKNYLHSPQHLSEQVVFTMAHELAHCIHRHHKWQFHALMQELLEQHACSEQFSSESDWQQHYE